MRMIRRKKRRPGLILHGPMPNITFEKLWSHEDMHMTPGDSERVPDRAPDETEPAAEPEAVGAPETEEPPSDGPLTLDDLLVRECGMSEKQVERARRVAGRLKEPKPISEVLVELGQLTRSEPVSYTHLTLPTN